MEEKGRLNLRDRALCPLQRETISASDARAIKQGIAIEGLRGRFGGRKPESHKVWEFFGAASAWRQRDTASRYTNLSQLALRSEIRGTEEGYPWFFTMPIEGTGLCFHDPKTGNARGIGCQALGSAAGWNIKIAGIV